MSDVIMKWVEEQTEGIVPIAFAMEWTNQYGTDAGKSAVIQLCADPNFCYVFQISRLKRLPAALLSLLYHSKVCLHGLDILKYLKKLQHDFSETKAEILIKQCKDLGVWWNSLTNSNDDWQIDRLVYELFFLRVANDGRFICWDVQPLRKKQILYAATDAYIFRVIYLELQKMERLKTLRLTVSS